jgi:hypothetical protein
MPTSNLDTYLHELDGAVALLVAAQDADGDDHHRLLSLAADAWREARDAGGFGCEYPYDYRTASFELERMVAAGVTAPTYRDLCILYTERSLAMVRLAQKRLLEEPLEAR